MSNIAVIEPRDTRLSVTEAMAERFGMHPQAFEQTLRATVFPHDARREEFAAFLLVAKEYNLNPITKEIYAFPKRGGGIIPIVSIDGWMNLINSHPAFDGMEFEEAVDDGELISTTCRIYRKDRAHAIAVTEWLSECVRPTDPWKMKHRMLRHKAAIQCARYAFGFAGIYDEDEAARFAANSNARSAPATIVSRPPNPNTQRALPAPAPEIAATAEPPIDLDQGEAPPPTQRPPAPPSTSGTAQALRRIAFESYREAALAAQDIGALDDAWSTHITPIEDEIGKELYEAAAQIDDTRRSMLED